MYNVTAAPITLSNVFRVILDPTEYKQTHIFLKCLHSETHHEFGFNAEVFMSSYGDVFLHNAEVIETTQKKTTAMCPQVKVQLFTCEPTTQHTKSIRLSVSTSLG